MALKTYDVLKTYSGPELLNEQAFLVRDTDETISFLSINGTEYTANGTPYENASGVLLLPGTYNIKVSFNWKDYTKKRLTRTVFNIPVFHTTEPQFVRAILKAGRCYRINPGVELYNESSHIYDWKPYIEDVTGNPDLYLCNSPTPPYIYSFQPPSSKITCSIEPSITGKWILNRNLEGPRLPTLLTFWKYTDAILLTSYVSIQVYFYDCAHNINPLTIDENWLQDLFEATYFQKLKPKEVVIEVRPIEETTIEDKKFIVTRCQMSYHIPMNAGKTYDEAMVYISQIPSSNLSQCFVFALIKSNYSGRDSDAGFSTEDMKIFTDLIKSMKCVISQD
jgi:hypothetical protein